MASLDVIKSILPLIQAASQVIGGFTGGDEAARNDNKVTDAFDVITAVVPLIDTFANGNEVTPDDVRQALAGYDQALADFDAEIARQGGG
jgi:hypothetical protein